MINKATRQSSTWSVSQAAARLDALLDATAEGVVQTIERNGVKFIVTIQRPVVGDAKELLLAGGPLEDGDLED